MGYSVLHKIKERRAKRAARRAAQSARDVASRRVIASPPPLAPDDYDLALRSRIREELTAELTAEISAKLARENVLRPTRKGEQFKRHSSERFRHKTTLVERWTNAKAGLIGFLTGEGNTSVEIEALLADGTSRETIRAMWKKWGLPKASGVKINLTPYETFRLKLKAGKHGLKSEEFCRRILATVARDSFDLYASITDGAFDKADDPPEKPATHPPSS